MVRFEFSLSDTDVDRLFALKERNGKNNLTGNEYARELLEAVLYQMHPQKPVTEDEDY